MMSSTLACRNPAAVWAIASVPEVKTVWGNHEDLFTDELGYLPVCTPAERALYDHNYPISMEGESIDMDSEIVDFEDNEVSNLDGILSEILDMDALERELEPERVNLNLLHELGDELIEFIDQEHTTQSIAMKHSIRNGMPKTVTELGDHFGEDWIQVADLKSFKMATKLMTLDEKEKATKLRRKLRNKVYSKNSRGRQKGEVEILAVMVAGLQEQKAKLLKENKDLKRELKCTEKQREMFCAQDNFN